MRGVFGRAEMLAWVNAGSKVVRGRAREVNGDVFGVNLPGWLCLWAQEGRVAEIASMNRGLRARNPTFS